MTTQRLQIHPGHSLRGEVGGTDGLLLPGDKSLSHRAALFAALATGSSQIENFLVSGVTDAMLGALSALGVTWELDSNRLLVTGAGLQGLREAGQPARQPVSIHCGNSATTLRLLAGAVAAWGVPTILDGSAGLRRRPMRRIVEPLQRMGVAIQAEGDCAPLRISLSNYPLLPLDYRLDVASAQVKSCLLLAGLAAGGPCIVREPGPSRDHTERMLSSMGVQVESSRLSNGEYQTRLAPASGQLLPLNMILPGDISAASFLIVAALITPGSSLRLVGAGLNPTRTGLLEALQSMGAQIEYSNQTEQGGEPCGDLTVTSSPLIATEVRGDLVVRMIDEFPIFAVAAAYAEGRTLVCDAQELRYKESDRIAALGQELRKLDVDFQDTPDGFTIQGGRPLRGSIVEPHGDHRLAMSLAVAGLAASSPVTVSGAETINESFPGFKDVLIGLGADLQDV